MRGSNLIIYRVKQRVIRKRRRTRVVSRDNIIYKSAADKKTFYDLCDNKFNGDNIIKLGIKAAGETPILIRNNNVDHSVVRSTFFGLYHLPPVKLQANSVIIDLGANIGLTMRHLKYLYPDST